MSLSVKDVLALEGLEPMLLRAGVRRIHNAVRWYYVAENEGIAEWVMGGELVFVTGINHTRGEHNLLRLLREGHERNIAGIVILTGEAFIKQIPASVVALADQLDMPLIEQPYSLKMVCVTQIIGTALVQRASTLRSRQDILIQMLTGEYPSLDIALQRARHLQLTLNVAHRVVAMRLSNAQALFDGQSPEQAEKQLQQAGSHVREGLKQHLLERGEAMPLIEIGELFILLLEGGSESLSLQKQWLQRIQQESVEQGSPLILQSGISSAVSSLVQLSQGLIEARRALDIAESMQPASGICDYAELGVLKLLSAVRDPGLVIQFMNDTLGKLHEPYRKYPFLLIETLEAILHENGNLLKAAERLHIHRNTLHQRVQRIEQQTEQSLSDPQFRLNASVALLIWRMSDAQHKQEWS